MTDKNTFLFLYSNLIAIKKLTKFFLIKNFNFLNLTNPYHYDHLHFGKISKK